MRRGRSITALNALMVLAVAFALVPAATRAQGRSEARTEGRAQGGATATVAPALLVADSVFITPDRKLIAEGNVEAFQGDIRLRASRIVFDRDTGTLTIDGPIRIDQGGSITVLADAAELDAGLQNGLLTGARMVLDQQLQMAALQMTRVGGRYTQLYKTAVTSCQVCGDGGPPLWQIRARKVIHDQEERQIYFEDAQFRILDVPVFYLPRFRLPDPTLERARGFLIPSIRTTSQLGTGLRLPYFIPMGDNKDLTLAPYVSAKTRTLNLRYRQAFRTGTVEFEGGITRDDLIPTSTRGYLFGFGAFDLPRDFKLEFNIATTTDNAYLVDYGLPNLDRLQSEIALGRTKRDRLFRASLINFRTLRDSENQSLIPSTVGDIVYQQRFFPAATGGEVRLTLDAHGHYRTADLDVTGRDVERATADVSWQRSWTLPRGLRMDWTMGFAADAFQIYDDSNFPAQATRATPRTALTLRYPMRRSSANGVTQFLEPVVQVGWTNVGGGPVPNDESNFVEFDQGNLLSLSRFPANDAREDGVTLVYGLNWSRFAPAGWQASATIGQVLRDAAEPAFTSTSGLSGTSSDFLLAGQLKLNTNLALTGRTLLSDAFSVSKAELRGDWNSKRTTIAGTYLWLGTDLAEGRNQPLSEFWFDGSYALSRSWTASAILRYDIPDARATGAGVGLVYRNECVTVDLSLNRRNTSSSTVEPSTDFGFTIALNGFSVKGATETYRRSCS